MKILPILISVYTFSVTVTQNVSMKSDFSAESIQWKADTLVVLMGQAKEVIQSKCMPCHSNHTFMPEARKRFNLDSINFLPLRKKVAKLDDMIYILEKGAMPHQRFLEMRPDGTLSYAERKAIEAWADKTAVRLTRSRGSQE